MKFIGKSLLIILSIPVFLLFVLSLNFRFQFLSTDFWIDALARANVYSQISDILDGRMLSKVIEGGGQETDVTVLSDLISPLNLKEFSEKNIANFLLYANGISDEATVFVPLSLRNAQNASNLDNLDSLSGQMTLTEFTDEFSISGINQKDIRAVSKLGMWSWIFLSLSLAVLILILVLEYLLIDNAKRLTILGVSFAVPGICLLGAFFAGKTASNFLVNGSSSGSNFGVLLATVIFPPIIHEVVLIWFSAALIFISLGILLFFLKKPGITKAK